MAQDASATTLKGRCYCGASSILADALPSTVTYCHCSDCRRWTGAPVAAFAQFDEASVSIVGNLSACTTSHVFRQFCGACGSPLSATFDYLPGQVYVPLGCLDAADRLEPQLHCHHTSRLPWLHLADDLPRAASSGRADLLRHST